MVQIYHLLNEVKRSVGIIAKTRDNTVFKYKFRGVEDVLGALSPALLEHGVVLTTKVSEHRVSVADQVKDGKPSRIYHATLLLELTFHAPDESKLSNIAAGEGLDTSGDKATLKAMSAAFKYAVTLGLCIPVDSKSIEDSDRNPRKRQDKPSANNGAKEYVDLLSTTEAAIRRATDVKTLTRYREAIPTRHFTADDEQRLLFTIDAKLGKVSQQTIPLGEGNPA